MVPELEYTHSAEKARDTTLNDEMHRHVSHVTSIVVATLGNQPIRFSDGALTSPKLSLRTSVMTSHVTSVYRAKQSCRLCRILH